MPTKDHLSEARELMAQAYEGAATREVALSLIAHAGQYVTALLNEDVAASRAFLVNVVAIGELLLARADKGGIREA